MSAIRIKTEIKKTVPWKLVIIFLCFSAAVILLGITLYTSERNLIFKEQGNSLKAIASLKIRQIEQWHSERIADATVIKNDRPLIRDIKQFINSNDNDKRIEISIWMKSVLNGNDYSNVLLIDTLFNVRLTVSQSDIVPGDVIKKDLKEVLINHNIIMTDLHRSEDIPWIHLDILVPLIDSVRKKEIPVGIIILRVSPEKILFPLIQSWPVQSKSSETLLIRKEGDSVLFLNELRHRQNTALNLRISIKDGSLPAAKAVNGVLGLVQGMDYRNIPVVAWLADVPDFSWKMVAKVDKEEILLPLKRYTILIFITVVLLILINASLFGFWIWQQKISSYKKQLQNEKSIHELEERFATAFRMSPVSITLSSMIDDKFIDVNSTFLKAIEYTREEVIGKTARELDIWANEDERLWVIDEIREKGEIFARIISFKSRSGKIIYGLASMSVVKVNGQPCNLSTIVNITERRKAEEELRESEERFRSLYENVSIGIYRTTLDGRILMANPAMINMLGFDSFEQLTQRNLELEGYEPGHPRSEFLETIEKQGKVVGMESAWQQRNGKTLFVRENANAIRDAQGRILYYDGTVEDITDRKKTEEALRDSEERFSKSFRSSPISFIIADIEDGKIIEVNDAFTTISGFTREEAIGMTTINLGIWVHEHDRDRIVDSLRKGNAVLHQETQLRAKDGKVQIVVLSAQIIKLGNRNCIISSIEDITERKHAEEALRESEIKFRQTFDLSPVGIVMVGLDKRFLLCNNSFSQSLGYIPEELVGKTIAELTHPDDIQIGMAEMKAIGKGELETSHVQKRYVRKDGQTVWGDVRISLIKNSSGDPQYFLAIIQDITERKDAEEALRESEDKFKYIFDHSVTGKSITLPTGEIHVNKAFCDMLGYRQDELEKTNWHDISHPDDNEMTQNIINSLLAGEKESARFVKRYMHKNGSVVWTDVGSALRRDEKGEPLYFLTAIIDITERKRAEESLRLKNYVFDDSIAANSISDTNGILTEVNAAFVRIWGYQSMVEVIGKSITGFIKETSDANKIVAALNSNGEWEGDYSAVRKDGSTFFAHGLATVLKDEIGKTIGYQSAVIDVTDAERAKELIHQLNEELEQKVIKRTELLEAANKELEAFSYSVSHDLRAPLRSVHGYTKILIEEYEDKLDDEGKRICGIISSSATQMGELIDDLLNFSRIGRSSLNPLLLDMKSIVISVFADISSAKEKSRTKMKIGKLHKAFGDANLIKLVWNNLISNAIKYSSKQNISEIAVSSQLKYDRITYSVKDNGVGFDMNYKHKLFGVFQRLHGESEFEGNGVGLAIVQRIILKHGGTVWAEGEVGKGATFYFSLPVQDKRQK